MTPTWRLRPSPNNVVKCALVRELPHRSTPPLPRAAGAAAAACAAARLGRVRGAADAGRAGQGAAVHQPVGREPFPREPARLWSHFPIFSAYDVATVLAAGARACFARCGRGSLRCLWNFSGAGEASSARRRPRTPIPLQAAGAALASAAKAHGIVSLAVALPHLPSLLPIDTPAGGGAAAALPVARAAAATAEEGQAGAAAAAIVFGAVGGLYEGNVRWGCGLWI